MNKNDKEKKCKYCGKPIAIPGKDYISTSESPICEGHDVWLAEYLESNIAGIKKGLK